MVQIALPTEVSQIPSLGLTSTPSWGTLTMNVAAPATEEPANGEQQRRQDHAADKRIPRRQVADPSEHTPPAPHPAGNLERRHDGERRDEAGIADQQRVR
jgi:hypothetical protein